MFLPTPVIFLAVDSADPLTQNPQLRLLRAVDTCGVGSSSFKGEAPCVAWHVAAQPGVPSLPRGVSGC